MQCKQSVSNLAKGSTQVSTYRCVYIMQGIHVTALREIKILKELHSLHVVELVEVFITSERNLSLVLEFMESDLEAVIKDTSLVLSPADIKAYMQMALQGLHACHSHNVMHRDIKPNNLLIATTGAHRLATCMMTLIVTIGTVKCGQHCSCMYMSTLPLWMALHDDFVLQGV